jgi:sugar phosphate isomerase/epimerase
MKLACADFTWPLLPHESVLALIRMLDVEGLDLGVFGNRSHVRPEMVRHDIPMWSGVLKERISHAGLELADFFYQPWSDFETMAPNNPDPKQQEEATALFRDMLEMARRLEAPGITMLPGARFGDEPWDDSIRRSAEALKWRVEAAQEAGMRLSVEGHMGSNVDTPEKLARLVELTPGLELTLDYTHFTAQGIPNEEIEPLIDHARHFHCRGAAPGKMQTIFEENTIDYARVVQRMKETGYDGYFAIEYAWTRWGDFKRTDNTSETIQFRDMARALIAGREYEPLAMTV